MTVSLLPGTALAANLPSFESFFEGVPATANQPAAKAFQWKVVEEGDGYALRSPTSSYSYSAQAIELTFTADVQFAFAYKISSEAKYDYLQIKYDGIDLTKDSKAAFSGEVDWSTYVLQVESGKKLELGLYRDVSGDGGQNCVWLRGFSAGDPFTVTFHDGNNTDTQSIFGFGTLKANPFTKDRAVFKGWATEENGQVVYADGASVTLEADMDLYTVWADAYVVTFDNNGAQTQVTVEQNTAIGDLLPTPPTRTGYIFDGWTHNGVAITAGMVITEDMICTAVWTPVSYTVRLEPNGGTGETVNVSAVYDKNVTLPSNTFTRSGYSFLGWSTSSYSTSATYADGATVRNLKNTQGAVQTLYAVWAGRPVQVTIDLGYETEGRVTDRACVVGSNYNYVYVESTGGKQYSALPDPKRDGYNFKGWYTQAEGAVCVVSGGSQLLPAEDGVGRLSTVLQYGNETEKRLPVATPARDLIAATEINYRKYRREIKHLRGEHPLFANWPNISMTDLEDFNMSLSFRAFPN